MSTERPSDMFDLDLVPERLRPTEACTNRPMAEIDDRCTEGIARFRAVADSIGDAQFTMRYSKAIASLAPFLAQNLDLANLRVLEVGSGHGAKSLALAPFVKSYVGLEIQPDLVEFSQAAQRKLGVGNVHFELDNAANIGEYLHKQSERFDVILLYAVLEHMTVEEKLTVLSECWNYLTDDGFLFIGETPNRMLPIDLHSSQLIYLQQAPLDIWRRSFDDAGNRDWAEGMRRALNSNSFELAAYRRGRHLGHQEFDLGLMRVEELAHHVVDDGFSAHIMNLYFYMPVELLKLVEFGLLDEYTETPHVVSRRFPAFLSRYFIEVLLSKRPAPPRSETTLEASFGSTNRVSSGSLLVPEVIAPGQSAQWHHSPPQGSPAAGSVLIGFQRPASIGQVSISIDGRIVDEFDVSGRLRLLRNWRQELVYEVFLPASHCGELGITNLGEAPCPVRFVGFR